jgi:hypothetical protein
MTITMHRHPAQKHSSYLDGLNAAVRDNPVAAGCIGLGLVWMVLGGKRIRGMAGATAGAAGGAVSAGAHAVRDGVAAAGSAASDVAGRVYSGAREAADAASKAFGSDETQSHHASRHRDYYEAVSQPPTQSWSQRSASLQQGVNGAFERHPLLIGALGLAAGAAIAASFKPTETEQSLMGDALASMKSQAANAADEGLSRMEDAVQVMADEASAQGLTPSAMKDKFSAAAEKVKTVAKNTVAGS